MVLSKALTTFKAAVRYGDDVAQLLGNNLGLETHLGSEVSRFNFFHCPRGHKPTLMICQESAQLKMVLGICISNMSEI